jgi:hypothetical protein
LGRVPDWGAKVEKERGIGKWEMDKPTERGIDLSGYKTAMRTILLLLFVAVLLPVEAQWRFGLKAGLNRSNLVYRWEHHESNSGAAITRFAGGFQIEIPLDEQWYLHTGPYYSGKGANLFVSDSTMKQDSERVRLNYIELPLMVVYKFPTDKKNQFLLSSGFYLGYGFNGTIAWKGGRPPTQKHIHRKEEEDYRRFEPGWMISAMYEIKSRYGLRLDFSKSLLNIQHPDGIQKNRVMGFSFYWYVMRKRIENRE